MRLSHFFSVAATVLLLPGVVAAEEAADATNMTGPDGVEADANPSAEAEGLAWDQFDDPEFDPGTGEPPAPVADEEVVALDPEIPIESQDEQMVGMVVSAPAPVTASGVVLGPEGVDDQGRSGRLHTVATGDTLWDLSAAYLGTPWVWPSVWIDNDDIANPHLILPGDKIWITANEMRVVSDAEAESFLEPVVEETTVATAMDGAPMFEEETVAFDEIPPLAALESGEDDPSTLDAFPVAIPGEEPMAMDSNRQITVASRERMGFVTAETLAGATSIVESPTDRTLLSTADDVYVGMGEGDTEVGDQFTIFRIVEEVRDVETNRILGHHVENLGWLEIRELTGDTSVGEIRQAYSDIRRGAQLVPREEPSRRVAIRITPDAIEGQIVFLPSSLVIMADGGYVYLNRGEFHGIEVGSELEVFASGETLNDRERRVDVRTPDSIFGTLVVVSVEPESSVAFVLKSNRELTIGDRVRPVVSRLAGR